MPFSIRIEKNLLNLATTRVQGALAERSLANIALKAHDGSLHIAATDKVLAVFSKFACTVTQEGVIFVPAKLFSDLVRELPDGQVSLSTQGNVVVVRAGAKMEFEMKLPLIEEAAWREPPKIDTDNDADLSTSKLSYMIDQVQFCVAQDSPRNYGAVGFLHRPDKDTIRLVGTDGFRLSFCEARIPMPDGFLQNGVCLSKRALNELQRMCSEGFEKIRLAVSKDGTTLLAQLPEYFLFVRLSAVKYPNYAGVVPEAKQAKVLLSRSQIQNVSRRVLLAADKSRALQLSFSDSSLTLASKSLGSSEGKESIQLDDYHGPRCDIAVNGKYLSDIFATTPSDKLTVQFKDVEDPVVIVPRDEPADCRSKHVLVPIREAEA